MLLNREIFNFISFCENLQGKRKLPRKIGEFEKWGVKLQRLTEEGKRLSVRVTGRFEKLRFREIGIQSTVFIY